MGRQIINTKGATRAIARRRIIAAVVLALVAVAVAVAIYFMRQTPHHTAAASRPAGVEPGSPQNGLA